ncbi:MULTISPECIES: transporter substrate-binding domain-containing protein [unclassified Mesorhizobium]|nr:MULTISPECIES: transporter substrate-binding domain-containing protein [unclassified Mesorhizobium]
MRFAFLQEPPFCFIDGSGRLGGSDAQLAKRVCLTLGLELLPIETEFAELLPGLAEGVGHDHRPVHFRRPPEAGRLHKADLDAGGWIAGRERQSPRL